ncbi:hypothetical protein EJB05_10132, partial [Eragrostis curvula]
MVTHSPPAAAPDRRQAGLRHHLVPLIPLASACCCWSPLPDADTGSPVSIRCSALDSDQHRGTCDSEFSLRTGYRFEPEKAGGLDTYKVQMAGFKASLSGSGKTLSKKVQKRIADYSKAMEKEYGEEWEKRNELDGTVMYQTFDGLKHGRFPMGNGSLKKAEVLATVKHKRPRYSGSSYQAMQRQNEELQQERTSKSRIDDSNNSEQEGVHAEFKYPAIWSKLDNRRVSKAPDVKI